MGNLESQHPGSRRPEQGAEEIGIQERLEPGQNFYEQAPFSFVFQNASNEFRQRFAQQAPGMEFSIAIMITNGLKTSMAKNDPDIDAKKIITSLQKRSSLREGLMGYSINNRLGGFFETLYTTFTTLDTNFIDWRIYAANQRDSELYNDAGVYLPKDLSPRIDLPKTYLGWIAERQAILAHMQRGVVRSTFVETTVRDDIDPVSGYVTRKRRK